MSGSTSRAARPLGRSPSLAAVWRARWVVLAAALAAGAGGYAISQEQPAEYTATGQVVLSANRDFAPLGGSSFVDSARYVATQVSIMTAAPVLEPAADQVGLPTGELASSLTVTAAGESDVITVQATATDPADAAERVNAVVAAYQEHVVDRVAAAAAAASTAAATDPLVVADIRTAAAAYGDGVALVESAVPPTDPVSPRPWRDALLLGLAAAVLAALLSLLRRPKGAPGPSPLSEAAGAPSLGTVPVGRPGAVGDASTAREHALALVALDFVTDPVRGPVLLTGGDRSDAAAAATHGLALAAAVQGRTVLLVDADPEGRALSARAGTPAPAPALTAVADSGGAGAPVVPGADGGRVRLAVLGGTADVGLPDDDAVRCAFTRLAASFDLVLVQAGPLTRSPVALALLRHATTTVAVVDAGSDGEELAALRGRLEAASRRLSGVLLTTPARASRRTGSEPRPAPSPARAAALGRPEPRSVASADGVRGG